MFTEASNICLSLESLIGMLENSGADGKQVHYVSDVRRLFTIVKLQCSKCFH